MSCPEFVQVLLCPCRQATANLDELTDDLWMGSVGYVPYCCILVSSLQRSEIRRAPSGTACMVQIPLLALSMDNNWDGGWVSKRVPYRPSTSSSPPTNHAYIGTWVFHFYLMSWPQPDCWRWTTVSNWKDVVYMGFTHEGLRFLAKKMYMLGQAPRTLDPNEVQVRPWPMIGWLAGDSLEIPRIDKGGPDQSEFALRTKWGPDGNLGVLVRNEPCRGTGAGHAVPARLRQLSSPGTLSSSSLMGVQKAGCWVGENPETALRDGHFWLFPVPCSSRVTDREPGHPMRCWNRPSLCSLPLLRTDGPGTYVSLQDKPGTYVTKRNLFW